MFWNIFGWCILGFVVFMLIVTIIGCAKMASKNDEFEEEYLKSLIAKQHKESEK